MAQLNHLLFSASTLLSTVCVVPVAGTVIRNFDAPTCLRCPGHRGVTLATSAGDAVVAVADGTVEFAGSVGGVLYVVQRVAPDVRVTYGHLDSLRDKAGKPARQGEPLGVAGPATYLSVRVGETHVEPLRALGLGRPRLVPVVDER